MKVRRPRPVFVILAVMIIAAELPYVPFQIRHSNALVTWLGYAPIWSPPAMEAYGEPQVQLGRIFLEEVATLASCFLTFPRH